jgi:aryl-alcohol dehydrogenase-like predicted oxidoreductase
MKTRTLGQNLKVSALGYGAMGLFHGYGQPTVRQGDEPRRLAGGRPRDDERKSIMVMISLRAGR